MITRSFAQIEEMLKQTGDWTASRHLDSQATIAGVSTDTRSIQAGQLFVPLIGERFNGHEYVQQALAAGARAALWQHDQPEQPEGVPLILVHDTLKALQSLASHYRRQLKLKVIAVTGSNGKTTTKDIIAELLNPVFRVTKTPGNLNNHIGLPLTILQCTEQTEVLVAEMGMSGRGEISLLSQLAQPDVAIITMIGESHLEQLGSKEAIAAAKLEIVDGLAADGLLVYNGDDSLLSPAVERLQFGDRAVRFGLHETNHFFASDVQLDSDGATFTVNHRPAPVYFSPLLGIHNVLNALIGLAVGERLGLRPLAMQEPLSRLKITGMRSEKRLTARGTLVLNDAYNASPSSVRAALELLANMKDYSRKIVVLGDMLELGEQSATYHTQIGERLDPDVVTKVYTYGQQAQRIAAAARRRFPAERVVAGLEKAQIADAIASEADKRTAVLVKGSRGMKLEETVHRLLERLNEVK